METASSTSKLPDPNFIKYLFNPTSDHDCYFIVGNPSLAPVEKIGVVKQMLFAHSSVMRSDLQVANMKEKKPIEIPDIFPGTFRDLLRFVYGFDTTATLSFDDADNLLYAAEKYNILELKNLVATRLLSLLDSSNVCILMNNRVCFETLGLNSQINKILQYETAGVFASPHFLELTSDAFVKLLEQETLSVREIVVWRQAIEWAKHKAKQEDGMSLRKELETPLKHIRVCTLQMEDFCKEVVPTDVLLDHEVTKVCRALGSKEEQPNLTEICNTVKVRALPFVKSSVKTVHYSNTNNYSGLHNGNFTIVTSSLGIEMLSISMMMTQGYGGSVGEAFEVSLSIKQEENQRSNGTGPSYPERKLTISCTYQQGQITIPISNDLLEVHLLPYSQYKINLKSDRYFNGYSHLRHNSYGYSQLTSDFTVNSGTNSSIIPINMIAYKTLTVQT